MAVEKTFTAHGPCGKCVSCRGQIRKGQKAIIHNEPSYVYFRHVECPNANDLNEAARKGAWHIQGAKH